jgi:hypothetical protein
MFKNAEVKIVHVYFYFRDNLDGYGAAHETVITPTMWLLDDATSPRSIVN